MLLFVLWHVCISLYAQDHLSFSGVQLFANTIEEASKILVDKGWGTRSLMEDQKSYVIQGKYKNKACYCFLSGTPISHTLYKILIMIQDSHDNIDFYYQDLFKQYGEGSLDMVSGDARMYSWEIKTKNGGLLLYTDVISDVDFISIEFFDNYGDSLNKREKSY